MRKGIPVFSIEEVYPRQLLGATANTIDAERTHGLEEDLPVAICIRARKRGIMDVAGDGDDDEIFLSKFGLGLTIELDTP